MLGNFGDVAPRGIVMTTQLTADQVWLELGKEMFGVLGMVTADGESRTVGIVFAVRNRKLYISSGKDAWKVRHVQANPNVSMTIPIAKRVPLMPWIKIPPATITFQGTGRVMAPADLPHEILQAALGDVANDEAALELVSLIEVTPEGEFVTYGVGISLQDMRLPEKARGRAPVM